MPEVGDEGTGAGRLTWRSHNIRQDYSFFLTSQGAKTRRNSEIQLSIPRERLECGQKRAIHGLQLNQKHWRGFPTT